MNYSKLVCLTCLSSLSWLAHANEVYDSKPNPYYIDLSMGVTVANFSPESSSQTIDENEFDDDSYLRLIGGYSISSTDKINFAVELFYANHGTSEGDITNSPGTFDGLTPTEFFQYEVEMESYGLGINIEDKLLSHFTVNGRIGAHYWQSTTKTSLSELALTSINNVSSLVPLADQVVSDDDTGTNSYVGFGMGFLITRNFKVNLDYTKYKFDVLGDSASYKTYGLGLNYKLD